VSSAAGIDVVIVSYRCEDLLRDCLASLVANPPAGGLNIHVVDNASGDGTAEMVRREFPQVELTVNPTNAGFSRANNPALARGDTPYALVLNPDTRVTAGALQRLVELMDAHPEVGIAGPRLELEDGTMDHASRRSFPTPLSALGHFTGLGRREGAGGRLADYRAPEVESGPVDAVNGAFMLIRRTALERVGAFDTRYWMYMEDLDLCYRFAEAGWTTWFEPTVTVVHVKAGTSGKHRSLRLNYAFHYGMFRFYRDHYAPQRNPLVNAAVYCGIAVKFASAAVRSAVGRLTRRGN
jgi:GT2 family glycosyltransferase